MSYLLKMIEEGEHQQQDFKMRVEDSRKIAKSLVAFANTSGGRLLIGVKDNGNVCGVDVEEEFHMIEAASQMYCEPEVVFETNVWHNEFKKVLEISVKSSDKYPHFVKEEDGVNRAYIRKDDKIILANGVQLNVWKHKDDKPPINFEYNLHKEELFNQLKAKGKLGFYKVSRITKLNSQETENLLAQLIAWKVLRMNHDEKGCSFSLVKGN